MLHNYQKYTGQYLRKNSQRVMKMIFDNLIKDNFIKPEFFFFAYICRH
jgi:hypothetical protein